jgi:hypothetical protein
MNKHWKINAFWDNLLLDLHKMWDGICNRRHNFWHQNNILKDFWKIFFNALKPFGIHLLFQTKITQDWNLINGSNNIVVIIIPFILRHINSSHMETKHNTQTFLHEIPKSWAKTVNSTLPSGRKNVILIKIK